jgi:hypothetical protein
VSLAERSAEPRDNTYTPENSTKADRVSDRELANSIAGVYAVIAELIW